MEIYIKEIIRLYGVPIFIIFDRDTKFMTFWEIIFRAIRTKLKFSIAFHLKQIVNQKEQFGH